MKIYQSLSEAGLYRTVALIPEQAMFGLALVASENRVSSQSIANLQLGAEFCGVFGRVLTAGARFTPSNPSEATIAAGLQEIGEDPLKEWRDRIATVCSVIADLLRGPETPTVPKEKIEAAIENLRQFVGFVKQRLPSLTEAEYLHRMMVA